MALLPVPRKFIAELVNERKDPTKSLGRFKGHFVKEMFKYQLTLHSVTGLTQAHLHFGKPRKIGAAVADLYGPKSPAGTFKVAVIEGEVTEEKLIGPLRNRSIKHLIKEILRGNIYVDIYDSRDSQGKIRGRLEIMKEEGATDFGDEGFSQDDSEEFGGVLKVTATKDQLDSISEMSDRYISAERFPSVKELEIDLEKLTDTKLVLKEKPAINFEGGLDGLFKSIGDYKTPTDEGPPERDWFEGEGKNLYEDRKGDSKAKNLFVEDRDYVKNYPYPWEKDSFSGYSDEEKGGRADSIDAPYTFHPSK